MKFVIVTLAAFALAAPAAAGNAPHPTLDQIATETAGKPVTAWCETSYTDWHSAVSVVSGGRVIGAQYGGFTFFSRPVIYLSPDVCGALRLALIVGYRDVGIVYLSEAVLTLLHEGVHQRGVTDEGVTDCTALPLVVPTMEKFFGLTPTVQVQQTKTVRASFRRKIAGKWRVFRYTNTIVETVTVPNPDHARALTWATAWHKAKPPAYQGNC